MATLAGLSNLIPLGITRPPKARPGISCPFSLGIFSTKINKRIFPDDQQETNTMCTAKL